MLFSTFSRKAVFTLVLALAALPVLSYAQNYNCTYPFYNGTGTCAQPGMLHVYVVTLPTSNQPSRVPADFTVVVHAQSVPQQTFAGSQSGTTVTLQGAYTVEVLPMQNYTQTYSRGCTGTIYSQEETCVITMSPNYAYSVPVTPYQYPYPYAQNVLTCAPAYQTVSLGQSVHFTAIGGTNPYTWSTGHSTYQAIGPVFNTVLQNSGEQTVSVSNGTQTAVCTVNVVGGHGPVMPPPTTISTISNTTIVGPATFTAQYVPAPRLPNTGFGPASLVQWIFAVLALAGVGVLITPYVRKSFVSIAQ